MDAKRHCVLIIPAIPAKPDAVGLPEGLLCRLTGCLLFGGRRPASAPSFPTPVHPKGLTQNTIPKGFCLWELEALLGIVAKILLNENFKRGFL